MDLYSNTIIKQPEITFKNIDLGEEGKILIEKIHQDQKNAQINANYWLDNARQKIRDTTENVKNYNEKFKNYHEVLVEAVNTNDKSTLKIGLKDLAKDIQKKTKEVEGVIQKLNVFKGRLIEDTNNLKEDLDGKDGLVPMLTGQNVLSPQLKNEIEALNQTKDNINNQIIGWGIGTGVGGLVTLGTLIGGASYLVVGGTVTPIIGVVGIGFLGIGIGLTVTSAIMLDKHLRSLTNVTLKIRQLTEKANEVERAVIALTSAKNQVTNMHKSIDHAINSLGALKTKWDRIGANYNNLLEDVETISPEEINLIKEDLDAAKSSWQEIANDISEINRDFSLREESKILDSKS
ncbi:HBL/NHE enterotoxin family protein [Bacillus sp. AR18-7]|uniref:HBL/NHE enterotoxin family protein n=1 Tax=Bacillus sp. AR18-7 TaxID=2217821 RepID=UPI0011C7D795|nr:HBL/NHE enterotoxin family protein [Bacillus sp. AR18-7]TXR68241.1 hemolysin BL lytic component L1 [Bacillus sp. AR18-7]